MSALVSFAGIAAARAPNAQTDGPIGYGPWGLGWPAGPALSGAVFSAAIALAAILTLVFVLAAWLLLRRKDTDRHAH